VQKNQLLLEQVMGPREVGQQKFITYLKGWARTFQHFFRIAFDVFFGSYELLYLDWFSFGIE
jgi:hypothetical protein